MKLKIVKLLKEFEKVHNFSDKGTIIFGFYRLLMARMCRNGIILVESLGGRRAVEGKVLNFDDITFKIVIRGKLYEILKQYFITVKKGKLVNVIIGKPDEEDKNKDVSRRRIKYFFVYEKKR